MVERYQCSDCGAIFTEPKEKTWREDLSEEGWGWCTFTDLLCPICGSEEIDRFYEVEDDA